MPKTSSPFSKKPIKATNFRFFYERGDFPIALAHDTKGNKISWKVSIDKLDYHHYLPMFFEGLCEVKHPYDFFAEQGVKDLLAEGGSKILPVVPQLIMPIKQALNTKHPAVVARTLRILQLLVHSAPLVGEALVPYYRQILPTLNLFKSRNANLGDAIEFSKDNIGDLVEATLEAFEKTGGADAFINIKYMVPTYESCRLN